MHFVYKTDNLFRSIRVSDKNSSVTPALLFLKLIKTPYFLCVQYAPFKPTSSTLNPFWHHLLFFMHLLIFFELKDPKIEKHYKWTLKRLKFGMVSSFHPHSMCKKTREGYGKNWMHFVCKMDNFFRSIRVSDETLILRKRLSSMYTRCVQFSRWPSLLFCTCYAGEMMIPCQVSTFSEFIL